jgi:hypothetical protein
VDVMVLHKLEWRPASLLKKLGIVDFAMFPVSSLEPGKSLCKIWQNAAMCVG